MVSISHGSDGPQSFAFRSPVCQVHLDVARAGSSRQETRYSSTAAGKEQVLFKSGACHGDRGDSERCQVLARRTVSKHGAVLKIRWTMAWSSSRASPATLDTRVTNSLQASRQFSVPLRESVRPSASLDGSGAHRAPRPRGGQNLSRKSTRLIKRPPLARRFRPVVSPRLSPDPRFTPASAESTAPRSSSPLSPSGSGLWSRCLW